MNMKKTNNPKIDINSGLVQKISEHDQYYFSHISRERPVFFTKLEEVVTHLYKDDYGHIFSVQIYQNPDGFGKELEVIFNIYCQGDVFAKGSFSVWPEEKEMRLNNLLAKSIDDYEIAFIALQSHAVSCGFKEMQVPYC